MRVRSLSEKDTQDLALDLSKELQGGEVVMLYGDLGSGKTVFTKALAKALGVKEVVKSPTFNLMKVYDLARKRSLRQLCHIDAYRLKNLEELLDVGAEDFLGKSGVVSVIEWAERIKGAKYEKAIKIKIEHGKKENERMIEINKLS